MSGRLKVRFLTAIWGARYVEEFTRASLPSYLAPGNLPALAQHTDLEVVILTTEQSEPFFQDKPAYDKLRSICPVKYIFIDDLITTGNYGVTLTLAYARGIRDCGDAQTETTFVFMNSDFVLADGSLQNIVQELQDGPRCLMAASLRGCAEPILPKLIEAVDETTHVLSMPPRDLVQLAFDNLHPTVLGKTVTQEFVTCITHNQIYWQVDKNTLLGRYHLIFMLAIRPEVPLGLINSYCDYGLVPELVPSGSFKVIDDSDRFFMLELQPAAQEREFLISGSAKIPNIAAELSVWTTKEHRAFAETDVVFRAGEPVGNFEEERERLNLFLSNIKAYMTAPVTHVDHYYWASGVEAWRSLRQAADLSINPPEILPFGSNTSQSESDTASDGFDASPHHPGRYLRFTLEQIYRGIISLGRRSQGMFPNVPVWQALWSDARLLATWVSDWKKNPSQSALLVSDEADVLTGTMKKMPFTAQVSLRAMAGVLEDGEEWEQPKGTFERIFIHGLRTNSDNVSAAAENSLRCLSSGGELAMFIRYDGAELGGRDQSVELSQHALDLLPSSWIGCRITTSFAGGGTRYKLKSLQRNLMKSLWPFSIRRLPLIAAAAVGWIIASMMMAAVNLLGPRVRSEVPRHCSSALLRLRPLRP